MKLFTAKDKAWTDAKGIAIPYTRIDALERMRERHATKLIDGGLKLEAAIAAFKQMATEMHNEVVITTAERNDVDLTKRKGNYTWFSFGRAVKVEVDMQDKQQLDSVLVGAAHAKLMELLEKTVSSDVEFLPELIRGAFENTRGALDARKVISLLGYRSKVKHALFQEACNLIEQSISVAGTKQYIRISQLQEDGSYRALNLNFSK